MHNLIDIKDFLGKKQTEKDKIEFIKAQYNTILELQKQNNELTEKLKHLEQILKTGPVETLVITAEEALINDQIAMLQQQYTGLPMELEDVKKLDLLLKNKQLLQSNPETFKHKKNNNQIVIPSEELLKLAKLPNE